jgi:hypothetical protein
MICFEKERRTLTFEKVDPKQKMQKVIGVCGI